ncbi:hypothetical protein [Georgenia yuyongxinii]
MILLTELQVWVLSGVFAAATFGVLGIGTTSFSRTLTTSLTGLREVMEARFEAMDAKIDAKFAVVEVRFEAIETRLTHLDRDVQTLMNREFGTDR